VMRFITNCREGKRRESALVKKVQQKEELVAGTELVKDSKGIWRCNGKVADYNPIFIQRNSKFAELEECQRQWEK